MSVRRRQLYVKNSLVIQPSADGLTADICDNSTLMQPNVSHYVLRKSKRKHIIVMKKITYLLIIISFIGIGSSFQQNTETPVSQIQSNYAENIEAFRQSIDTYLSIAEMKKTDTEALYDAHIQCRLNYKKIEHIIGHYDEQYVKFSLNGAPLPVIKQTSDSIQVVEPEGLQILDELVAEDEPDLESIIEKLNVLQNSFSEVASYEKNRPLEDKRILEAMRSQIVRVFALSLTGFDTPGSSNGIAEAKASLESMFKDFSEYESACTPKANTYFAQAEKHFTESIDYLNDHTDFNTFNRLHFIREWMNPLSEAILDFHLAMQIRTDVEERAATLSINYHAKNPFSDDFLNPYYYTYLKPHQNNSAMVKLGAYLFFEPALSVNNKMSCGTCHHPSKAFTDGLKKSRSNHGEGTVLRNAPTIINAVYSSRHFYDLRSDRFENQAMDVIQNADEFSTNFEEIREKLSQNTDYQELFDEAFGYATWSETKIDQYTITTALASFVKSIRSFNSPFDKYIRKETQKIEPQVEQGFNLFMGKAACGTCHFAPTFNGLVPPDYHENETEVLGVPADTAAITLDADVGRFANGRPHEAATHYRHSFKTVTVRNVAVTSPYMHNGVYETLEEVVDFYNNGGGEGMGLDVDFQTLAPDSLDLNVDEQQALIKFMEALTDTSFQAYIPRHLPKFNAESGLQDIPREVQY